MKAKAVESGKEGRKMKEERCGDQWTGDFLEDFVGVSTFWGIKISRRSFRGFGRCLQLVHFDLFNEVI